MELFGTYGTLGKFSEPKQGNLWNFGNLQEPWELLGTQKLLGTQRNLGNLGNFREPSELQGTLGNFREFQRTLSNFQGIFGNLWEPKELFRNLGNYFGIFGHFQELFLELKLTNRLATFPFLELYTCDFPLGSICLKFWFECFSYDPGGDVGILDVAGITKKFTKLKSISRKNFISQTVV